jgi:hypothetical protein
MAAMPAVQRKMFAMEVPLYRRPQDQRKPFSTSGNPRCAAEGFLDGALHRPDFAPG